MSVTDLNEYDLMVLFNTEESNASQDDRINAYYIIKDKVLGGWKTLAYPIRGGNGEEHNIGYLVSYRLLERDNTEMYFLTKLLDSEPAIIRYCMVKH